MNIDLYILRFCLKVLEFFSNCHAYWLNFYSENIQGPPQTPFSNFFPKLIQPLWNLSYL